MKLTVLVDNNTYIDQYYFGEPALCFHIEDEGTSLLLDIGYSDLFSKNSNLLNIDLEKVETLVISHGHDDHTRGLKYYLNKKRENLKVIAHPNAFKEKKIGDLKISSPVSEDDLREKCSLHLTKEPVRVSKNIFYLGEIPQKNNFEIRKKIGQQKINGSFHDDYVIDDTALVYKSDQGIYIITGCSHSGICNIIEYAKEVCNDNKVLGVVGGFHLFEVNDQVDNTITYFKNNNIKDLYPCHCTSFEVKAEINKHIKVNEVGVGLALDW